MKLENSPNHFIESINNIFKQCQDDISAHFPLENSIQKYNRHVEYKNQRNFYHPPGFGCGYGGYYS